MLNNITIQGRLTRDPELRYTQSNKAVTTFAVACERDFPVNGEKITDFIDCVVWTATAEFIAKHFRKGDMIVVQGSLYKRKWTDKNGDDHTVAEVLVQRGYFCGGKKQTQELDTFSDLPDEDDFELPFN